jgi:hypothetical protein
MKIILAILSILVADPQDPPQIPSKKTFDTDKTNLFKDRSDWIIDLESSRDVSNRYNVTVYYLKDSSREKKIGIELKKSF